MMTTTTMTTTTTMMMVLYFNIVHIQTSSMRFTIWNNEHMYVCIHGPDIPICSSDLTWITPRYWNSLFQFPLPGGKYSTISANEAIHMISINFLFHLVPITAGWPETVWIQGLTKAFTHDQRCRNQTSRPLDLGSNALTTRPCAPL